MYKREMSSEENKATIELIEFIREKAKTDLDVRKAYAQYESTRTKLPLKLIRISQALYRDGENKLATEIISDAIQEMIKNKDIK